MAKPLRRLGGWRTDQHPLRRRLRLLNRSFFHYHVTLQAVEPPCASAAAVRKGCGRAIVNSPGFVLAGEFRSAEAPAREGPGGGRRLLKAAAISLRDWKHGSQGPFHSVTSVVTLLLALGLAGSARIREFFRYAP